MGNSALATPQEPGKCSSLFQSCSTLSELDVDELAIQKESGAPRGKICAEAMRFLDSNSKSLLFAATSQNPLQIRRYLSQGISPETYDQNRTGPLHIASRTGSLEVVKELINYHCNINLTDCAGWSGLHVASHCGNAEIVEFLLKCGADAALVNSKGLTPFDLAIDVQTQKKFFKHWGAQDRNTKNEGMRNYRPATPCSQESSLASDNWTWFGKISSADLSTLEPVFINVFNINHKKGLSMLAAGGLFYQTPASLASYLHSTAKLSASKIGETLGDPSDFFREVCKEYMNLIQIEPHNLLSSLSRLLRTVKLPKGLMADQILSFFAFRFFSPDGPFNSEDAVHRLVFSIINLNSSLHNLHEKVTRDEFIHKNKGMHDGGDFPEKYLNWIYENICCESIESAVDEIIAPVFEDVVQSGYLKYKVRGSEWKEKYFVMNLKTLWCFKASTQITPYGFIPLWKVRVKVKGMFFFLKGDVNFWKFCEDGRSYLQKTGEVVFKMDATEGWTSGLKEVCRR